MREARRRKDEVTRVESRLNFFLYNPISVSCSFKRGAFAIVALLKEARD
jgi:hypothetical protein